MRPAQPLAPMRRKQGRAKIVALLWDPKRPTDPAPTVAAVDSMSFRRGEQRARLLPAGQRQRVHDRARGCARVVPRQPSSGVLVGPARHQRHRSRRLGQSARAEVGGSDPRRRSSVQLSRPSTPTRSTARCARFDELGVLVVIPQNGPFGSNRGVVGREYPNPLPLVVDGVTISVVAEAYIGAPPNLGVVAHELGHLLVKPAGFVFRAAGPPACGRASRSTTRLRRATTA